MDEIEQLLAAEEIKKLKARRDRALDTKDWPLYASLHLPGCRIDDGSGILSLDENMRSVSQSGAITVHHSHTPEISFVSAGEAQAIWAFEELSFDGDSHEFISHSFGFHREAYRRQQDCWLISDHEVQCTMVRNQPDYDVGSG